MAEAKTETLLGGPLDGYAVPKSDSPHMYAGFRGDGWIHVYLRGPDGRLRYSHREAVPAPAPTPGHWPCACVRRDRAGNLKAIKMHPPSVNKCRRCGATRPPGEGVP